jgi:hypothetical protein
MPQVVIREVSFDEFSAARSAQPEGESSDLLMALFERKGVRLQHDQMQPTPPADVISDLKNQRFIIRQEQ